MAEHSSCTTEGPPPPPPSSSSLSSSPFNKLATDHILSILLLLPANSILAFSLTCKRFSSLTRSDFLWEAVCRRDWGHHAMDSVKGSCELLVWKKLYRRLHNLDYVRCHKLLTGPPLPSPDETAGVEIPRPRASHSLNFVSGCLILFGGGCEGGRHLDDSWVAYMSKDLRRILKWEKINTGVPTGRFGHTCVSLDDSLVVFGGINDQGGRHYDTWVGLSQLTEPFSAVLSWRLVNVGSVSPPARGAHAGCCIGRRKVLIHGGIGLAGVRLQDTWVLHLSENLCFGSWQEIATNPSPPPRSGHTVTHIGGSQAILFGGRGNGYEVLDDVWLFDASEDFQRWVQLPFDVRFIRQGSSLSRVGHSACRILGGRVLIFGGEDSNRCRKNDFWVLDVSAMPTVKTLNSSSGIPRKMWRKLKAGGDMPGQCSFHRACVDDVGRYLYVFGGMVDDLQAPPRSSGLRFDAGLHMVELVL